MSKSAKSSRQNALLEAVQRTQQNQVTESCEAQVNNVGQAKCETLTLPEGFVAAQRTKQNCAAARR